MYSFLPSLECVGIKKQVREQIFSLLGNSGKTLFQETLSIYAEIHTAWYENLLTFVKKVWKSPYKKAFSYLGILLSSILVSPPDTSFAADSQKFIVTAYYSPLPNQSFYLKGNYEAEKRLNGNGTHGASGAPVFTGMIAAPKSYNFGTHIFFDGLGLGTVSDRGGAIVEAWDRGQAYDRIDIWMGFGESGLKRALAWGRREVVGTFVTNEDALNNMNSIDLEGIDNGRVSLVNFPAVKAPASGKISSDTLSAFADLGYNVVDGNTEAMILQFQLDYKVIANKNETGAGNYGPKTKEALKNAHDAYALLRNQELESIEKARQELLDDKTAWEIRYKQASDSLATLGTPRIGESGSRVVALQGFLAKEGFFSTKKDGKMNQVTLQALKKYQKARGIAMTGKLDDTTKQAVILDMLEA